MHRGRYAKLCIATHCGRSRQRIHRHEAAARRRVKPGSVVLPGEVMARSHSGASTHTATFRLKLLLSTHRSCRGVVSAVLHRRPRRRRHPRVAERSTHVMRRLSANQTSPCAYVKPIRRKRGYPPTDARTDVGGIRGCCGIRFLPRQSGTGRPVIQAARCPLRPAGPPSRPCRAAAVVERFAKAPTICARARTHSGQRAETRPLPPRRRRSARQCPRVPAEWLGCRPS